MPSPRTNSAGPIWSKKIKGPTIWRLGLGECATHLETTEIAGTRNNHGFDQISGTGVARGKSGQGCQLMISSSAVGVKRVTVNSSAYSFTRESFFTRDPGATVGIVPVQHVQARAIRKLAFYLTSSARATAPSMHQTSREVENRVTLLEDVDISTGWHRTRPTIVANRMAGNRMCDAVSILRLAALKPARRSRSSIRATTMQNRHRKKKM